MTSRSKFTFVCVAIAMLVVVSSVRAQTDTKKEKEAAELEKKTLLNEIASASWGLKLPENRIFIMANVADLLWPFDEKRARNLYWEAVNSINSAGPVNPKPGETLSPADREKLTQAYILTIRMRQTVLRQVVRHDSQLALDMLRASRQAPPRELGLLSEERHFEQEIAGDIAVRDSAQALQFARESLAKGLTWELVTLLQKLQQRDAEKASVFAGEIITKLQTTNVATDLHASITALYLLQASRTRETSRDEVLKPLSLTDDQKHELVETLIDAALSASANSHLLFQMNEVMPEIEQFFPERRAAVERKLATFNQTLSKEQRYQNTYNGLIERGRQEDIVRIAASGDSYSQAYLYQQAVMIAVARGNTDAFREFLNKEVSDSGERRKILDLLDAEEINMAVVGKKLDHLRKMLPNIERKEERARAMAELAIMLKEKGEDAEAATLLDEAAGMIKTNLKDEKQTNALLSLLCAYAVVDPPKAFVLAERTVDRANSQISLLMLLDRVVKSGAVKKSEIILEQAGMMQLDFMVFKYGKGVAALARADFNRTRALADRFDRNELRLLAQLLIVKGLLQPAGVPQ
ncbi:MAG: hypothetical protein V7638_4787 [Acidobacteriota bacterium]